ncbi:type II and III secretion system protein family protein [Candidatus Laterigemmans baculatus]|uniref:type II and III secretion system protein family protein n=1 Tax=Candidatus Laterigemmans baculatus TaxID=2770505 RepID=UPI0013DAEA0D|nr:pilus assembly protein N-terminal domain-containing protein [Candidatus Laterigemmans baculatus]
MVVNYKKRRRALVVLLAGLLLGAASASDLRAQTATPVSASAVNYNVTHSVEQLQMIVKSSRILTLDKPIPKFQVQNEQILSATPISSNQIQVSALAPGMTQLNLWDSEDQLYTVDVAISADAREVEGILATQFPGSNLRVTALSKGAVLSGTVTNVDDVDRALQIVEQFYAQVVTNVRVVGVQQIMLHTKIMEVSRTKFRELGVDWVLSDPVAGTGVVFGAGGLIDAPATDFTTIAPLGLQANTRIAASFGRTDLDVLIKALRQNELVKVLAEPTVVATHGRPARFIVGGKVPYIVPTGNGSVSVQYEEFGTSVDFMPFVVGPGRVRLEVRPEVSEPDPTRSLTAQGIAIPAFRQRYVETAVEMNAGQTFAIAGLLQTRVEATSRATPFFGELPVIGTLFRRVREENNEIELLITVTPELAEAMDPMQVPLGGPGMNSASPTDKELYIDGHLEVPRTDDLCPAPGYNPPHGHLGTHGHHNAHGHLGAPGQYPTHGHPTVHGHYPVPDHHAVQGGEIVEPLGSATPIVPSERPTHIAPGVMIMSPSEDPDDEP